MNAHSLAMTESRHGKVCVLSVSGRIDSSNSAAFMARLGELISSGVSTILVDLASVMYLTSATPCLACCEPRHWREKWTARPLRRHGSGARAIRDGRAAQRVHNLSVAGRSLEQAQLSSAMTAGKAGLLYGADDTPPLAILVSPRSSISVWRQHRSRTKWR